MDIQRILDLLPHRYPFLLVDRVLDYQEGEYLEALKNVSFNEPFFQGHFPGLPVMPGVLVMEAMAQAGGLLVSTTFDEGVQDKVFLFTGMEKVRFRKPVRPGDQLVLRAHSPRTRMRIWKMQGEARVDGALVAEAVLSAAVLDREEV
jgi:3-hydroxyacyl-[acyl-carrier-protein] dehydratase